MPMDIPINKLAKDLELTSRTLRYWEAEGLFKSTRDINSGWRLYNDDAVLCIKIVRLMRRMDVPIQQVKKVLLKRTAEELLNEIESCIASLKENQQIMQQKREKLLQIKAVMKKEVVDYKLSSLSEIASILQHANNEDIKEVKNSMDKNNNQKLRVVALPPMRVVYNIFVGVSPEDEAMRPVVEWLKNEKLLGTARLFGGNMPPMPGKAGEQYGYGMCASIPENISIPKNLKEMHLPGGLYASQECEDDIEKSWNILMKRISRDEIYKSDRSRLCFEEHIRNDNPEYGGNEYSLVLLEPIMKK